MFNSTLLNNTPANGYMSFGILNTDDVVFEDFSLSGGFVRLANLQIDNLNDIELNGYNNPQESGGGILTRYYRDRNIVLSGVLSSSTAVEMYSIIDELKKRTKTKEGNLDIKLFGEYRRIQATVESITFDRQYYHTTFLPFTINFVAKDPFFRDIAYSEASFTGKTASFQDEVITYGTTDSQSYTTFSFTSASGVTSVEMEVEGVSLTYTGTITTSDVLTFDGETKRVLLNGSEVDYDGYFQPYITDTNIVSFTINGTFTADISCLFKNTYL